ncbi:MAG: Mut7-C RNAse domain-containing protein [bacterium]
MNSATIRFYEELNDFLPRKKRKISYSVHFRDHPSIKHIIEAEGVPHTEVDHILINGRSVSFQEKVYHQDFISVYPVFESFDISSVSKIRQKSLRIPRFILDVHLGKLARYLRMLGFDSIYSSGYSDKDLVGLSISGKRTVLTRDRRMLMNKELERGYWIRSDDTIEQVHEVIHRFDLTGLIHRYSRCTLCNGMLSPVDETLARKRYPDHQFYPDTCFYQCGNCSHLYWKGSHCERFDRIFLL